MHLSKDGRLSFLARGLIFPGLIGVCIIASLVSFARSCSPLFILPYRSPDCDMPRISHRYMGNCIVHNSKPVNQQGLIDMARSLWGRATNMGH